MATPVNSRFDQTNDFYQSFRFIVYDDAGGSSFIQSGASLAAGFSHCSMPEHSVDHTEYSEGSWTYSKVFPGRSTFSTVTLSRGVAVNDTKFANWIVACAEGKNYRTDVTLVNFHRQDVVGMAPEFSLATATKSLVIVCKNCMPIRFRPGNDFDSMSSDISINEIEFQPEFFKISKVTPGTTAPGV